MPLLLALLDEVHSAWIEAWRLDELQEQMSDAQPQIAHGLDWSLPA